MTLLLPLYAPSIRGCTPHLVITRQAMAKTMLALVACPPTFHSFTIIIIILIVIIVIMPDPLLHILLFIVVVAVTAEAAGRCATQTAGRCRCCGAHPATRRAWT